MKLHITSTIIKPTSIITLLLLPFLVFSQVEMENFVPLDSLNHDARKELTTQLEGRYETLCDVIKSNKKGKQKKALLEFYEKKYKDFIARVEKGEYHFKNPFTDYCEAMIDTLRKANPGEIPDDLIVLVSKSPYLNAYDVGNQILVVNLGTFGFLKNEEQLKSVIAHELAHIKLNHVEQYVETLIGSNLSKKFKSQVKEISKQRYNKNRKGLNLMKSRLYQNVRTKRANEVEADSLGFKLFTNATKYPQEVYFGLKSLDEYNDSNEDKELEDQDLNIPKETYRRYFNLPSSPFDEDWLSLEDNSSYNYDHYKDKFTQDSLKTHPETEKRIEKVKEMMGERFNSEIKVKKPSKKFNELQKFAIKQHVDDLYNLKRYGYSIFVTLYLLRKSPNDTYLLNYLGYNFRALHKAKKEYRFNRYVPKLNPKLQSDNTLQFLNFLWNLELEDFKAIADHYAP